MADLESTVQEIREHMAAIDRLLGTLTGAPGPTWGAKPDGLGGMTDADLVAWMDQWELSAFTQDLCDYWKTRNYLSPKQRAVLERDGEAIKRNRSTRRKADLPNKLERPTTRLHKEHYES